MSLSIYLIWFLVGVAFLVAEIIMPAFILIFFTVGCWITALVVSIFDIELTSQTLIFIAASLTLLFTLRKYSLKVFRGKTCDDIDDKYTDSQIGKTAIVTKKITPNMYGEIKALGSFWRAVANEEIEKGASVLIEEKKSEDGLTFKVKQV
ncbi:MAG: NfeD family protein [Deltaproteobacteria bacterium]|nr:NfeD family protein [Deltaproteobacteria bacterium]